MYEIISCFASARTADNQVRYSSSTRTGSTGVYTFSQPEDALFRAPAGLVRMCRPLPYILCPPSLSLHATAVDYSYGTLSLFLPLEASRRAVMRTAALCTGTYILASRDPLCRSPR